MACLSRLSTSAHTCLRRLRSTSTTTTATPLAGAPPHPARPAALPSPAHCPGTHPLLSWTTRRRHPQPAMLYLTADKFPVFVPFGIIGFYRYFWYIIRLLAAFVYRPVPPPLNPTYVASEDVTIIVPTIDAGEEFKEAAFSWLQSNPAEIIIVTETKMVGPLQQLAQEVDPTKIRVITVPKANKRLQMVQGIKHTTTDIIVFADDDSIWPPTMLQWMLACFEDQQVGGVGTSQRVKSTGAKMTVWETLAAFRLSIRNFEIASSTHIDGGVPCLSGRTAAYRTVILKDPAFIHGFTNDYWLGKYLLNSGDDKFLTRWMVSHGWNTYIQVCPEVELLSTMKPDWRFLKQVLRWTRNTWRSDIRSVFTERYVWTRHPYTCYTMLDKFINPFTLLSGPALVLYLLSKTAKHTYHLAWWDVIVSYVVWITATRTLKLLPHLWFRPLDIIYVPAYIAFGYYFAIMKLYALCTLHVTAWGTRAGVGEPDDALNAEDGAAPDEKLNSAHAPAHGPVPVTHPAQYDAPASALPSEDRETYFASGAQEPRDASADTGDAAGTRAVATNPFATPADLPRTSTQTSRYDTPVEGYETPRESYEQLQGYTAYDPAVRDAAPAVPNSATGSGATAAPVSTGMAYGHSQASSQSATAETWPTGPGSQSHTRAFSDSLGGGGGAASHSYAHSPSPSHSHAHSPPQSRSQSRQTPSTGHQSDSSRSGARYDHPIELTTF